MKDTNPPPRHARFAGTGQRLVALVVLAVFAGLVWLAWSGRFDGEISAIAAWMQRLHDALVR